MGTEYRSATGEVGSIKVGLKYTQLTDQIIGVFYDVYNELGWGYLESVYENALILALAAKGLSARQQVSIPVSFRGHIVGTFAADILVESTVILELKAVKAIEDAHRAQLMNYLRATEIEIGLLLNFGQRPEFKRLVLDNNRKKGLSVNRTSVASLLVEE